MQDALLKEVEEAWNEIMTSLQSDYVARFCPRVAEDDTKRMSYLKQLLQQFLVGEKE